MLELPSEFADVSCAAKDVPLLRVRSAFRHAQQELSKFFAQDAESQNDASQVLINRSIQHTKASKAAIDQDGPTINQQAMQGHVAALPTIKGLHKYPGFARNLRHMVASKAFLENMVRRLRGRRLVGRRDTGRSLS